MIGMGSVSVLRPGELTDKLLDCLRSKATTYNVEIHPEPDEDNRCSVSDLGERASDLPAFLEAQLDACASELGCDWSDYLTVP